MATTTARQRTATPFTRVWNQAKKLDDSEKLQLVSMLVESVRTNVAEPRNPRLYDPETGEYLNDETMQLIEDVRSGKEKMYKVDSFEEYLEMVKDL